MLVRTVSLNEEGMENNDFQDGIIITFDDKKVFSVVDGEPEDNNLSRNFGDCYSILELLEQAYNAGKNGEDWTFVQEEVTELD
jgi:hypothetical protein